MLFAAVFSIFMSKLADQYRCVRKIFFVTNVALIAGNLLYMVPTSPWFLLLGRILAASGTSQRTIITAEISRSYRHEELTSKFSFMAVSFSVGLLLASIVNSAFLSLDFWWGSWHMTFANFSGFYMAVMFTIALILCHFMIHDFSKQYDSKSHYETTNIGDEEQDGTIDDRTTNDRTTNDRSTNGHAKTGHASNDIIDDTSETSPLLPEEKKIELLWFFRKMF